MVFHPGSHGINFFCRFLGWLNLTADFADTMGRVHHPDHNYLSRGHRDKLGYNHTTEIHKEVAEATEGDRPGAHGINFLRGFLGGIGPGDATQEIFASTKILMDGGIMGQVFLS